MLITSSDCYRLQQLLPYALADQNMKKGSVCGGNEPL